jgi:hypothetical protein
MGDFYLYFGAVATKWFVYMTAGPFLLDEVLKRIWPKGRAWLAKHIAPKKRRRLEVILIIFGVFYAGFLAFRDEHKARVIAEAKASEVSPESVNQMKQELEQIKAERDERLSREWSALTNEQIEQWAKALADYHIQSWFVLMGDTDSQKLAHSLLAVSKKLPNCDRMLDLNPYKPGITIQTGKNDPVGPAIVSLFQSSMHIRAILEDKMNTPGSVYIYIGEKQ